MVSRRTVPHLLERIGQIKRPRSDQHHNPMYERLQPDSGQMATSMPAAAVHRAVRRRINEPRPVTKSGTVVNDREDQTMNMQGYHNFGQPPISAIAFDMVRLRSVDILYL